MILDNSMEHKRSSADIVLFDQVDRDTLYLVYVNLSTLRMKSKHSASFDLSKGVLKVYSPFYDWPVLQLHAPQVSNGSQDSNWVAFCMVGGLGLKGIVPVNTVSKSRPNV